MGWSARAADASRVLVDRFWRDRRGLFRHTSARLPPRRPLGWVYWWQAHALDALVLAGDGQRAMRLLHGVLRRNRGAITNDYSDDMAWMGLALHGLRTTEGLLTATDRALVDRCVAELLDALRGGVHPVHGGLVWRRRDAYLNVPANAPAALLAARQGELDLARKLMTWVHRTLVTGDGDVYDGLHPGGAPDTSRWTYNYGTVIAADLALGELDRARRVAGAALRLAGPDGILPDEGTGDRALFKGIFARHLAGLVEATGDAVLRDLLVRNAEAAWAARSPAGLFGPDWTRRPTGPVQLSAHLSGVLLLHAVSGLAP